MEFAVPNPVNEMASGVGRDAVDEHIREGLRTLVQDYAQLKVTNWGTLAEAVEGASPEGMISLWVAHYSGGRTGLKGVQVPQAESYNVLVVLRPIRWPSRGEWATERMYPGLGLMGQTFADAGNNLLRAELRKLIAEALAPLEKLSDRVQAGRFEDEAGADGSPAEGGPSTRPATQPATRPATQPATAPAEADHRGAADVVIRVNRLKDGSRRRVYVLRLRRNGRPAKQPVEVVRAFVRAERMSEAEARRLAEHLRTLEAPETAPAESRAAAWLETDPAEQASGRRYYLGEFGSDGLMARLEAIREQLAGQGPAGTAMDAFIERLHADSDVASRPAEH
jgi:hypothetical protein